MRLALLIVASTVSCIAADANATDFETVWSDVSTRSFGIQAERDELDAARVGASRAGRHWAPRLVLGSQWVSTNDPATTLFSTLGARSLLAADLSPSTMNQPPRQGFKRAGLTLDWALFEGGSKTAVLSGARLVEESRELALEARLAEEYSRLASEYARWFSLQRERGSYQALRSRLEGFLSRYRVGSKDNPVGYSGLLGMKSLLIRLNGLIDRSDSESASLESSIRTRSGRAGFQRPSPDNADPQIFVESRLGTAADAPALASIGTQAMQVAAQAGREYAQAEKARWLPKVGLFATGSLVSSPRDTGTSAEFGAYLQWELFNAGNFGASSEAQLRARAMEWKAEQAAEASLVEQESLKKSLPALRENLARARESNELTSEQVDVTERLFRNGSINALQFVEVLSRRADVVQGRREMEFAYIHAVAEMYRQKARRK